jgi:AAHS family 3-hydroxyphenylpropionic acid transporter
MNHSSPSARALLTISLCFLVAFLEGLDLQSVGIAGAGMSRDLGLSPRDLGAVFSAGILGLLPGSLIGGIFADRYGRRGVLLVAMALFGGFSLLTAYAPNLQLLLAARLMTGVGLGAALPTLISLSAEAAPDQYRGRAVSLMFCGMPIGGVLAAVLGMEEVSDNWRMIFYVGGIAPIILVPVLYALLPESQAFRNNQSALRAGTSQPSMKSLFGPRRTVLTLTIWLVFFLTMMVVYILLNWLPSLLVAQGLTHDQAIRVQAGFSTGAAFGSVILGNLLDQWRAENVIRIMYLGIILALGGLCLAKNYEWLIPAGFLAGFFTIGGQLVLYAVATLIYPSVIRSTGLGFAVTCGRVGAMIGPLLVGQLLLQGLGTTAILIAALPCIITAAVLAAFMIRKSQPALAATA